MRYLVNQLKYLGWELRPDLMFLDSSGDGWYICRCSKAQIKDLVYKDWWKIIAAKLPEQPGYRRAPLVSFSVSFAIRKIAKCSIPIVGSFTVGAAMSSDQKRHFLTGHDSLCKFCGSEDGYAHRLRACPHYAQARANIFAGFLDSLDDEILLRGLWPEPPEQTVVSRLLGALPQLHVPLRFTEPVQLFTDGSTNPHRFVPLSTWAVVHASPSSFENAVVEMGVLPGQQSNYRAELYALFVAVQLASSAIVYSDNLRVVLGFRVLLTHGWVSSRFLQQAETELWWQIWQKLAPKRDGWQIHHVKSHTKPKPGDTFVDKWLRHHNDAADKAAKAAHNLWPQDIVDAVSSARRAYAEYIRIAKLVFPLQEEIVRGQHTASSANLQAPLQPHPNQSLTLESHQIIQDGRPVSFQFQPQEFCDALLGPRFIWVLQAWMKQSPWVQSSEWVSILELYLNFVASTGRLAPVNVAEWDSGTLPLSLRTGSVPQAFVCEADYATLALNRQPLGKQATVFLHALKYVCKKHALNVKFERRKSLQHLACTVPVASSCVVPRNIRQAPHEMTDTVFNGRAYPAITRAKISAPVQAMICPIPLYSPVEVWNEYVKLAKATRQRHGA